MIINFCCFYGESEFYKEQSVYVQYGKRPIEEYSKTAINLAKNFLEVGQVDVSNIYTGEDLKVDKSFLDYCSTTRGYGYWRWKPMVILKELDNVDYDDYVIYHDVGSRPIDNYGVTRSIRPFLELIDKQFAGIGLFQNRFAPNYVWTKKELFEIMKCDSTKYHNAKQVLPCSIIVKKTSFNVSFIEEWSYWMNHPSMIYDDTFRFSKEQYNGFIENRHDMSVLTNLHVKHNVKPLVLNSSHPNGAERNIMNYITDYCSV